MTDEPKPRRDDTPLETHWIERAGEIFSFRLMLTPMLVRIAFALGIPIIPIVSVCYCFDGYSPNYSSNGFDRFIGGLLLAAFALLLWRIACETAIVLFSIHEEIRKR